MKRLGWIVAIGALAIATGCTDMSSRQQGTVSGAALGGDFGR
jgi:osmotically inducible lipoprotein OsmB